MEKLVAVKILENTKMSHEEFVDLSKSLDKLEQNSFNKRAFDVSKLEYEFVENPFSIIYLYFIDDNLVGYLDYWVTFDSATIFRVGVDENVQKQGIGSKLMNKMIEDIKDNYEEVFFISLEVRKSNIKAQKLYSKFDFFEYTTKQNYYEDGEDALLMGRNM
jgi:ribosomal-protein-alanine N-acetyltransferase